jgi:hypothetical protein
MSTKMTMTMSTKMTMTMSTKEKCIAFLCSYNVLDIRGTERKEFQNLNLFLI